MSWLSLMAQLGININPYVQGLMRAKGEASKFGNDVGKNLKNSLAGAFGAAAILGFARKTMEFGGQITDLAARLDVSTTALQEWNYAASQNGATADDVTSFFEKLAVAQGNALEGNTEALSSFNRLGVSLKELQSLRAEEIGKKIADTVRTGDIQKVIGDLRDVGGKSATALVAAFKGGLSEAAAEAHELGLIIDKEMIAKMDQLGDRADQLTKNLMGPMATLLGWINAAVSNITKTFQLLGAYSTHWKGFLKGGFDMTFTDFLGTQDAQQIVNAGEGAPGKTEQPRELRKFTPKAKKTKFENDLLGKEVGRLGVDSLAQVGGFLGGAARVNPVVDIARQQLKVQQEIARNTKSKEDTARF